MWKDIQDALLSGAEVAVFAWSLLDLLLTRILPFAGFLAGYLLLQFWRLLASFVIAAASWWKRQAEYYCDVKVEELLDAENAQKDPNDKLEESLRLPSSTLDEDADVQAAAAPTDANTNAAPDPVAETVHAGELVPSDAAASEVQVRGSDHGQLADVAGEEQRRVWATTEESDVQSSSIEGDVRRGITRRKLPRVLPPSLSQIKRTLAQRSRRASLSPASMLASMKKEKQGIGTLIASPAHMKTSSSYDNFMRKFRKQFLLDSA